MLKKNKRNDDSSSGSTIHSEGGSPSTIGYGTSITGDIISSNDIRVDGQLKGNIECTGKLIIGPKAMIEGSIICANAIVEGKFKGQLNVKNSLEIMSSAHLEGDIVTSKIQVQSGANFNVTCNTGGKSIKSFTREVDEKGEVVSLVN